MSRDFGVFSNWFIDEESLQFVLGKRKSSRIGQSSRKREAQVFDCTEVAKEIDRDAEMIQNVTSLTKLLQEPHIRRQASVQLNKMNIIKNRKDNAAQYEIKIKENRLEKYINILENLNDQLRVDPALCQKLIEMSVKNREMSVKVFEENEYTHTLNYMSDRYKKMLLCKQQPLQNRLIAYEFLMEELGRWKINLSRLKMTDVQEVSEIHSNVAPLKKELLHIRQYVKFKEICKEHEQEMQNVDLNAFGTKDHSSNMGKTKRDTKKIAYQVGEKERKLMMKAGKWVLNDIVEVVQNSKSTGKPITCPNDPLQELHIDKFFIDQEVREEDADRLIQKNESVKKEVENTSRQKFNTQTKEFVSREYVIMVKENLDMYRQKKERLEELKRKRDIMAEQSRIKSNELMSKVAEKISKYQDPITDRDSKNGEAVASEYGTDATTQDDRINSYSFPMTSDEIERVSLITNKVKTETQQKLKNSKELIFAA